MDYNKKAKIKPIDDYYDKCFQYNVTLALNHEEIGKKSERNSKIKLFINKYNMKGINYHLGKDVWRRFEKNNLTIVVNVIYVTNIYILPEFENTTQIMKTSYSLNGSKERRTVLS